MSPRPYFDLNQNVSFDKNMSWSCADVNQTNIGVNLFDKKIVNRSRVPIYLSVYVYVRTARDFIMVCGQCVQIIFC